jgi:hypothetical protein
VNQSEWLLGVSPADMIAHLRAKGLLSDRKLRLFAVACCRQVWPLLTDERSRWAVEVAERFADGEADQYRDLLPAAHQAYAAWSLHRDGDIAFLPWAVCGDSITDSLGNNWFAVSRVFGLLKVQAVLLRCIFGNAFRPVGRLPSLLRAGVPAEASLLNSEWLTPTVLAVAASIYERRAWDEMPILADALDEAGCTDAAILMHLRGWERCSRCLGDGVEPWLPEWYGIVYDKAGTCKPCDGTGWVHPRCPACINKPRYIQYEGLQVRAPCPTCKSTGHAPAVHCRGDWALDLILAKS